MSQAYPEVVVEVYNRWGMLVFKSAKGYPQEWNGRHLNIGKDLPTDSYYYVIDLNNGTNPKTGVISIIR